MAVVQNRYSANGSNTIFTAEFEVFSESHILVFLNDDEEQLVDKTAYDLINNAVVFKEAPADGTIVNLKIGTTPDDLFSPIVYYATASASADAAAISEANAATSATNAATSETNAANSATSASTSEANAATSETNASNSATSASTSAASAASSATSANNSVTIATTKASEASASATAAATSASNASTSESNAFTYMNDASSSASSASTYATQSSTSATNAANSATDAATSASNASASATSASTSETNAATSETNAANSATNAFASETAAATSETNASNSATASANSATASASSAAAALASETAAATSETNAAASESAAATSESNASASATSAANSASAASLSASAASTSETNAASSASSAATSEANASYSASSAATSETNAASSASGAATSEANAATSEANALASETNAATSEANAAVSEANAAISAAQASLLASSEFSKSGYTTETKDRWLETDTPNVIVDKVGDAYVIDGVIYSKPTTEQATLPLAPFAPTSTDELLDDKVNGLTTQSAHSKGDIVVTGNELVTNGTFDTDISGWTAGNGATLSSVSGQLNVTSNSTDYGAHAVQGISTVIGQKYILNISCISEGIDARIRVGNYLSLSSDVFQYLFAGAEDYTREFTATATTTYLHIEENSINKTSVFDNISVKLKDSIYQATEDTTAGTLLSDTSKFQKLDFVSRQDLIYLTATGYKTKKGIHNFLDTELVEGGSDLIASRYGYSKLGNGLYEIDGEKATALQVTGSRLNAGAYHPNYNFYGVNAFRTTAENDFQYWYHSSVYKPNSIYDCMPNGSTGIMFYNGFIGYNNVGSVTATNSSGGDYEWTARPDSKFYDKIYLKGENGLAPHSLFYAKDDYELPRDTFGLSSGSVLSPRTIVTSSLILPDAIPTKWWESKKGASLTTTKPTIYNITRGGEVIYDRLYIYTSSNTLRIMNNVSNAAEGDKCIILWKDYGIDNKKLTDYFNISKHPQLLTYAENLTVDLIGDPEFYPSEWKSYLAGGGVSGIVPNLVDDEGNSNIPDGATYLFKVSNKNKDRLQVLETANSGGTYSVLADGILGGQATIRQVENDLVVGSTPLSSDLLIASYSAYNKPYVQLDPQKITKVTPKSIATNSHSVYKDSLITWLATDKIAVGNGSNGYESKYLENGDNIGYVEIANSNNITVSTNEFVLYLSGAIGGTRGKIYRRLSSNLSNYPVYNLNFTVTSAWEDIGYQLVVPQHSTHQLDNSYSSACKYFEVEFEFSDGSKGEGVITQELIFNTTNSDYGDDTGDYGKLTNGTDTDLNGNTIKTGFFGRRK